MIFYKDSKPPQPIFVKNKNKMTTAILTTIAALAIGEAKITSELKKFVLVVRVPQSYDSEQAKKVGPEWDKALEYWKAQGAYMESFAFPQPGFVISGSNGKAEEGMIICDDQKVVSIVILRAENMTEAKELAKQCPVINHGGTVEVRERP